MPTSRRLRRLLPGHPPPAGPAGLRADRRPVGRSPGGPRRVRRRPPPLAQGRPAARPRGVGAPARLGDGPAPARGPALAPREGHHAPSRRASSTPCTELPDQQRKVLLLTHLAALSGAEIGRELGETTEPGRASASARRRRRSARAPALRAGGPAARPGVAGPDRRGDRPARPARDRTRRPPAPPAAPRHRRRPRSLALVAGRRPVRGDRGRATTRRAPSRRP